MTIAERQDRLRRAIAAWVPGENGGTVEFGTKDGKAAVEFCIPYGTSIIVTNDTEEEVISEAETVLSQYVDASVSEFSAALEAKRKLRIAVRAILGLP